MILKKLVSNVPLRLRLQSVTGLRCYCSKTSKILETAEEEPVYLEDRVDISELEAKRNKSRLNPAHRNILFGQKPYEESMAWYHDRVKYKKRILGRYGLEALGVPAGLAWPTPEEIEDMKEYERVAFPLGIQERLKKIKEEKREKAEALIARQKTIEKKMTNMQNLIAEVQAKIAKKQAIEEEARLRKQHRIEEVRQQLIAQGSMTRDKLEKALAQAEKDEKKKKKEAKRLKVQERQERFIKQLAAQTAAENADTAADEDPAENEKE